jgi:hypothetical protein
MLTVAASAVAAHADENAEEHADVRPDGDEHALPHMHRRGQQQNERDCRHFTAEISNAISGRLSLALGRRIPFL